MKDPKLRILLTWSLKVKDVDKVEGWTSSVLRAKAADSLRLKVVDSRKVDDIQAQSGGCC